MNKTWLEDFVLKNDKPFPIIGSIGTSEPSIIPLGEEGEYIHQVETMNQQELNNFLVNLHKQAGVKWSLSGDREFRSSLYRQAGEEFMRLGKTIHVGVDINVAAKTQLYAPYDGEVTHVLYEEGLGGYGWIIALKIKNPQFEDFYLLFGHLSKEGLPQVGAQIKAGEPLAVVGDFHENGNWFHHVHFQAMSQAGITEGLIYEALFSPDEMKTKLSEYSPSVMPIIKAWSLE